MSCCGSRQSQRKVRLGAQVGDRPNLHRAPGLRRPVHLFPRRLLGRPRRGRTSARQLSTSVPLRRRTPATSPTPHQCTGFPPAWVRRMVTSVTLAIQTTTLRPMACRTPTRRDIRATLAIQTTTLRPMDYRTPTWRDIRATLAIQTTTLRPMACRTPTPMALAQPWGSSRVSSAAKTQLSQRRFRAGSAL